MQITIFGAAGIVGKRLCEQAVALGWRVTAYDRTIVQWLDRGKNSEQFFACKGYLMDKETIAKAIQGADAVVISLTSNIESGDKSRLIGCRNIIEAMQMQEKKRLVIVSTDGIMDNGTGKYVFETEGYPSDKIEKSEQYASVWELLKHTQLQYTMVCVAEIMDAPEGKAYHTYSDCLPVGGLPPIQAGDLARYILRVIGSEEPYLNRVGLG